MGVGVCGISSNTLRVVSTSRRVRLGVSGVGVAAGHGSGGAWRGVRASGHGGAWRGGVGGAGAGHYCGARASGGGKKAGRERRTYLRSAATATATAWLRTAARRGSDGGAAWLGRRRGVGADGGAAISLVRRAGDSVDLGIFSSRA
nr:glycine-rich protein DOT1-like [Lolium perenne]